jgi:hypothetical protein
VQGGPVWQGVAAAWRGALIALVGALAVAAAATFGFGVFPLAAPVRATGSEVTLPSAAALIGLGGKARALASVIAAEPVLRQVDIDPAIGSTFFHFTDARATFEVKVRVPQPDAPPDDWAMTRPPPSPLVGHPRPRLALQALRAGPAEALHQLLAQWPGCAPRAITLYGEGQALTWSAFCTLPDGRVASGMTDGRTGAYRGSQVPPVAPPPTVAPAG